ncbi:MAG TPA: DUF4157 domain-containing protein [Thermoanaerobaculia bacterium]|nr:DUF4157 domain-containing protein [Thermoanaerobaculia bacterium]
MNTIGRPLVVQGFFPGGRPALPAVPGFVQAHPAAAARPVAPHVAAALGRHAPAVQRAVAPSRPSPVQPSRPAHHAHAVALPPGALGLGQGLPGQPLAAPLRHQMEAALGADFADVRVHVGAHVSAVGALAFTCGTQIHFAPGQFQPSTVQGRMLIAHELVHVIQQRAGRVRNPFGQGLALVQEPGLEAEAQRLALKAGGPPPSLSPPIQRAAAPWSHRLSVLQAMLFKDLEEGKHYLVDGVALKLKKKKAGGWLEFKGLPKNIRAAQVTGPASPPSQTVTSTQSKKRKFEALSDYPFRTDAYSDSEDDLESDFADLLGTRYKQPQARKGGYKRQTVKLLNATKWHPQKNARKLDIDNTVRNHNDLPSLEDDAKAIHTAAGLTSRASALTIVCALACTKLKALKKFCFSNLESTLSPKSRAKAHELGYHVIYTNQAHAEGEMMAYLESRDYKLVSMGCDKGHGPECNRLTRDVNGGQYPTESEVDTDRTRTFTNYYMPPLVAFAWKQDTYDTSDEYRPSKEPGFDMTADFSRAPDLTNEVGFVKNKASVNRKYYGSPQNKKKRRLA